METPPRTCGRRASPNAPEGRGGVVGASGAYQGGLGTAGRRVSLRAVHAAGGAGRAAPEPHWEGPYQCPRWGGSRLYLFRRGGGGGPFPTTTPCRKLFPAAQEAGPGLSYGKGTTSRGSGDHGLLSAACPSPDSGDTPAAQRVDAPGALNRGAGGPDRTNAGCGCEQGRANQRRAGRTTGRGRGGSGLCARSRVAARGLSGLSARPGRTGSSSPSPVTGPAGTGPGPPRPLPPPPAPSRPAAWEAPGPFGRTPTHSMPRVRGRGGEELGGCG